MAKARTVISVALSLEEKKTIDEAAQRAGVKLSTFIRNALLTRSRPKPLYPTRSASTTTFSQPEVTWWYE